MSISDFLKSASSSNSARSLGSTDPTNARAGEISAESNEWNKAALRAASASETFPARASHFGELPRIIERTSSTKTSADSTETWNSLALSESASKLDR